MVLPNLIPLGVFLIILKLVAFPGAFAVDLEAIAKIFPRYGLYIEISDILKIGSTQITSARDQLVEIKAIADRPMDDVNLAVLRQKIDKALDTASTAADSVSRAEDKATQAEGTASGEGAKGGAGPGLAAPYLVVAGGDAAQSDAAREKTVYAERGYSPVIIRRNDIFRTVIPARSVADANAIAAAIADRRPDAYVVRTATWCPVAVPDPSGDGVLSCTQ